MGVSIKQESIKDEILIRQSTALDKDIHIFRGEDYLRTIIPQMPGYENKVPYEKETLVDELDLANLVTHAEDHIKSGD